MDNNQQLTDISNWLDTGSINIFGRPFAGKDTQAERLAKLFNGVIMGGGDILRNSIIPDDVAQMMNSGNLIPTEAYVRIVLPHLSKPEFAGKPLFLSSVGRMNGEQAGILAATEAAQHPTRAVIYLAIDEDTVRRRWQTLHYINDRGSRADDTLEILDRRLQAYREQTLPVIDDYRTRGLLIEVDGMSSEDDVTIAIVDKLSQVARS